MVSNLLNGGYAAEHPVYKEQMEQKQDLPFIDGLKLPSMKGSF